MQGPTILDKINGKPRPPPPSPPNQGWENGAFLPFARLHPWFGADGGLLFHFILSKIVGEYVSRDLSWSNHVDAVVNNANKVVGLIKRTVDSKNKEIFSMFYKSLVKPILEYTCPVWSPYLVKDKLAIEKVQRRASRVSLGQKLREVSYEERCMYC